MELYNFFIFFSRGAQLLPLRQRIHIHTVAIADTIPAILPIPASVPELSPCPPPESFDDELGLDAGGAVVDV